MAPVLMLAVWLSQVPVGTPSTSKTIQRGEKLKGLTSVELAKLLAAPKDFDGKEVALQATVRKACTRKGCWMELASDGSAGAAGVRVTFKDYGFFVPLDSAGSVAKVEGQVKVTQLSKEKAEHYASEGATVPKDKDGNYHEVQLVAVAVELERTTPKK
jgi:Domain of unknown function (DUF4920)